MDHAGCAKWLEAYDLAGLAEGEAPPPELRELASHALVVSSDIVRARLSAELLAPDVVLSPHLRELELVVPRFGGLRLPMPLWALLIGLRWQYGAKNETELHRARDAARLLASLAAEHGDVVAVTHGAVRRSIADALVADGWRVIYPPKRKWAPWSAWEVELPRLSAK